MFNNLALKLGITAVALTSIGAIGVAGVVYGKKINDAVSKKSSDDLANKTSNEFENKTFVEPYSFAIVKAENSFDSSMKELYEDDGKTKNFTCEIRITRLLEDENCELFEINSPEENKLNNLSEIKNSNTKAKKEKIKKDRFFKLIMSDDILDQIIDWREYVTIVSKDELNGKNKKIYGSLALKNRATHSAIEGNIKLMVGKMIDKKISSDLSGNQHFKCLLSGETNKENCSLFKISDNPSLLKELVLNATKQTAAKHTDYKNDDLYVIEFKNLAKKRIFELNKKHFISLFIWKSERIHVATLQFEAALSPADESFFNADSSKIILL